MARISLTGVKKRYDKTEVIHGFDMTIEDGEMIVLVGPSGCGKSTLLRMIAGLEAISAGEIAINGRVVNELEPKDRNIAMVFQNYALYPHMSVFDNMAYGLKIAGVDKAQIRQRVEHAAGLLELKGLLERKPRQLSGGQRQRVAMGRAIVRQPAVFLFDEPLSNLDAKLRVQMRLEIKKLQRQLGITSIYVTHDQVEAMTLADRLVVMHNGQAEQIGRPVDVYHDPETVFVGGFIGSPAMNFFESELRDGRIWLQKEDPVSFPAPRLNTSPNQISVGIRPEHFHWIDTPASPSDARLTLSFYPNLVEPLGADSLIHGTLGNPAGPLMTVRSHKPFSATSGKLSLAAERDHIYLFDAESGQRLRSA